MGFFITILLILLRVRKATFIFNVTLQLRHLELVTKVQGISACPHVSEATEIMHRMKC
jgi:hypothetical protein